MLPLAFRPDAELRILEEHYAPEIFSEIDANREHLRPWLPWVDATRTPDDVVTFIRRGLEQFARKDGFHAGVWWQGRYCGGVGMKPINWPDSKVEIGYWIAAWAQGHGLVTDACRRLVRHIFDDLGLHRVEMRVAVGNDRSAAVALRLGATLEGVDREATQLLGRPVDVLRFGLLRGEFRG